MSSSVTGSDYFLSHTCLSQWQQVYAVILASTDHPVSFMGRVEGVEEAALRLKQSLGRHSDQNSIFPSVLPWSCLCFLSIWKESQPYPTMNPLTKSYMLVLL